MSDSRFPWRTLLFISLAVNLLIVGAVAGALGAGVRLEREANNDAAGVERFAGSRAFLRALPPETRVIMREELEASWGESLEKRQAAVQARRDAFAAVAQEPYDAERARAAFERLRAADQAAVAVFHDNVVEAFGELTPEQRREALEGIRNAASVQRGAGGAGPGEERAGPATLSPEERQTLQERRRERRERWRQRREERLRQQQQSTP